MSRLVVIAALVLACALVSAAQASPYLSKTRAHREGARAAHNVYLGVDEATDWWAASARDCVRRSRSVVDCDIAIYADEADGTIECDDVARVRMDS